MIGGVLDIIYGIAAISNSHFYVHNTHYVFGSLKSWGWITLIIGVLGVTASLSLYGGGTFGRIYGMIVGSLAALAALLSIPAYPFLSLAIFALSVYIVWGLAVYEQPDAEEAMDAELRAAEAEERLQRSQDAGLGRQA
jgi:hypothetical protein